MIPEFREYPKNFESFEHIWRIDVNIRIRWILENFAESYNETIMSLMQYREDNKSDQIKDYPTLARRLQDDIWMLHC